MSNQPPSKAPVPTQPDRFRQELITYADRNHCLVRLVEEHDQPAQAWRVTYTVVNPDGSEGHLGSGSGTTQSVAREHAAKQAVETLINKQNKQSQSGPGGGVTHGNTGLTQTKSPGRVGQFKTHLVKPLMRFLTMPYIRAQRILQLARSVHVFHMQSIYLARQALHLVILLNDLVDASGGPDDEQYEERNDLEDELIELSDAMKNWGVNCDKNELINYEQQLLRIKQCYTGLFRERFYFPNARDHSNDPIYQRLLTYDERTIKLRAFQNHEPKSAPVDIAHPTSQVYDHNQHGDHYVDEHNDLDQKQERNTIQSHVHPMTVPTGQVGQRQIAKQQQQHPEHGAEVQPQSDVTTTVPAPTSRMPHSRRGSKTAAAVTSPLMNPNPPSSFMTSGRVSSNDTKRHDIPGGPPKFNPDTRPLLDGWITQYDTTYNAWFYVNTRANPPKSEWKHPADLYGQVRFAPPLGGSPPTGGSAQSYYQGTDAPSPYPQQARQLPAYRAYSPLYPPQPEKQYSQTLVGGGGGMFGGGSLAGRSQAYGGGGYPQQPVYQAPPHKKSRAGRNAGGGGLLGGFLLADSINDMGDDRREEQAYDQGYYSGNDGHLEGGGDNFGGDF